MILPFALSLPRVNAAYPGGWTLGDYNVISFPGTDPFGNTFTFHAQVFVPLTYDPGTPCKALMCGHGSGERGGTNTGATSNNDANNTSQISNASTFAAQWLTAHKSSCDHLVLFPQTQLIDLANAVTQGWSTQQQADQYIGNVYYTAWQYFLTQFNVSKKKITGFSSGGFAQYNLFTRQPTYWDAVWVVEGDVNWGDYPYNRSLTQSQLRQQLPTTLAGSSTVLWIYQDGDDGTVVPAGPREIASVLCGASFTTPFTTAPSYSPNPYSVNSSSVLSNGATYKEFSSGGHDTANAWTNTNITAFLAI